MDYLIESWWRHCGAYDREQASPLYWDKGREDVTDYFKRTDDWWDSLTPEEKRTVYDEYFNEN